MKTSISYITVSAALATLLAVACGGSDSDSGAGSNNAGGSSAAGSSAAGKAGTSGAAGKAGTAGKAGSSSAECTGLLNPGTCATCIEAKCCKELAACNDDGACLMDCLTQNPPAECAMNAALMALDSCAGSACMMECGGGGTMCDPVTNAPCDASKGEACDFGQNGAQCFDPPNDTKLCGACDNMKGPFCVPGAHCIQTATGNQCARFCCTDADCGANGKCDQAPIGQNPPKDAKAACDAPTSLDAPSKGNCADKVGVCVVKGTGTGGAGGAAGAGGSGTAGTGTAGTGTAGTGTAGTGTAGAAGDAGAPAAGAAGSN